MGSTCWLFGACLLVSGELEDGGVMLLQASMFVAGSGTVKWWWNDEYAWCMRPVGLIRLGMVNAGMMSL